MTNYTKAGGGCGGCHERDRGHHRPRAPASRPARSSRRRSRSSKKLTNIQKIKLIEETIEREIRPELQKDGGDIELVDVEGNRVTSRRCAAPALSCRVAQFTLQGPWSRPSSASSSPTTLVVEEEKP